MANFTVNFTANTLGDHYICYREIALGGAFTCTTENVTATGPMSVVINVPFNLYCDTARLEGYIIAACENQDDLNTDGFPDASTTFTVTMNEQTDPCPLWNIECTTVGVAGILKTGGGTGYTDGTYPLQFTDGTATTPVTGTITVTSGVVISPVITDGGAYTVAPTTVDVSVITDPGGAVPPTFSIAMAACDIIDTRDYDCQGDSGIPAPQPLVQLQLNESVEICADPTTLVGLDSQFTATDTTDTCHCIDCQQLQITNATGKTIEVYYQTCWENNDVNGYGPIVTNQVFVIDGVVDQVIDCVIPDTVQINSFGSAGVTVTFVPCP